MTLFFIIASAFCYALSFIISQYFWWMTFLFPVFLLQAAKKTSISFIQGYLWGLIAYGITLSSVFIALFDMSVGPLWIRLFPSLLLFLYLPLFPAALFFIAKKIINNPFFTTIMGLLLTIYTVDQYALLVCARLEGYMLAHPLIPLCQVPQLIWALPYIGLWPMTIVWMTICVMIFLSLDYRRYIVFFVGGVLFLCAGFLFDIKESVPVWVNTVIAVPKLFGPTQSTEALISRVRDVCKQVIAQYPQVEVIIFPEGALYCKDLACNQLTQLYWSEQQLGKKVHIILGTFHQKDVCLYNSLQWFYNGTYMNMYNKQHVLPITERLPWWLSCDWYKNAYFSNISEIVPSTNQRSLFVINQEIKCMPFICSEFFCTNTRFDSLDLSTPLIVCNDSWFWFCESNPYLQTLMLLGARFRAIALGQALVYIAFSCAYYIDMHGNPTPIIRCN